MEWQSHINVHSHTTLQLVPHANVQEPQNTAFFHCIGTKVSSDDSGIREIITGKYYQDIENDEKSLLFNSIHLTFSMSTSNHIFFYQPRPHLEWHMHVIRQWVLKFNIMYHACVLHQLSCNLSLQLTKLIIYS